MTMVATCCAPPPRKYAAMAVRLVSLKPCPFCGSEDILIERCSPQAECWDCGAKGPLIERFLDSADGDWTLAAVLSWNTRADKEDAT